MKPSESVRTFLVERRASDGHWLCRAGTFDHQGSNVNCLSIRLARTPQEAKFADLSLAFGLTRSESEVLGALMLGNSPRTAGERLGVSINTVRTHVRHVHEKLDVSDPYSLLCKLSAYRLR